MKQEMNNKTEETLVEKTLLSSYELEALKVVSQPKHRGRKRSTLTEDRPTLSFEKMRELLEGIKEIETPKGIKYIHLRLTKKMVIGVRESSGKEFTINLDDLYKAYNLCLRFTSPEVKRYVFMGHSPAVTLLRLLKDKVAVNE